MQRFSDVVLGIIIGIVLSVCFGTQVYQRQIELEKATWEEHPLCKDTRNKTAWIAHRSGELRCFLESDDFPYKAIGTNVE